ncbi:lytic transglycosylase domain-containing protein [Streptomyces sp. LP05-1]|uniref:Lytic transglycosylase domain-containing protein n=1 Tax=Streptomyces pyxinae TaxID=2970734 RepID=A0ABT2CKM7_9ACTN|nr:lytic transglycosylase domain-containing protein [Streptomyces sp. LP05-1]MCS0637975.1 lytic transglycosylase domain-containing protein [Streptomyces sp. LP05-1]
MAALTASQAPGVPRTGVPPAAPAGPTVPAEPVARADRPPAPAAPTPGDGAYHTELPPAPDVPSLAEALALALAGATGPGAPAGPVPLGPAAGPGPGAVPAVRITAQSGIPATVLTAYRRAEASLARTDPGCRLPWQLLAAIGRVESGQANGGRVDARGTALTPILGPVLNGAGFARITDTDGGRYDGDPRYDRAVGPMQFIPSTWARWGADGNGDGRRDPQNVHDAALAAGHYLCAGARNLTAGADLDRAILAYNHSDAYLRTVLSWLAFYRNGVHPVPDGTGVLPAGPATRPATRPAGAPAPRPDDRPAPGPAPAPSRPAPAPATGPGGPVRPDPSRPAPVPTRPAPSPTTPPPTPTQPAPPTRTPEPPPPTPTPEPTPTTPAPPTTPTPDPTTPVPAPDPTPDPVPTPEADQAPGPQAIPAPGRPSATP